MIDIDIHYSSSLLLISIGLAIIMLLIAKPWKTLRSPMLNNGSGGVLMFFILYTIFCVFAFWAEDTYNYWRRFLYGQQFYFYNQDEWETIYNWLANILGQQYFLWRFIIWGGAVFFTYLTTRYLKLMNRNFVLAFLLLNITGMFSAMRGSVGHCILIYGAVLFAYKEGKTYLRYFGLALIVVSYYFHKSMYVCILFFIISYYLHFGKKVFLLSLVSFPFLTTVASIFIGKIVSGNMDISFGEGTGGGDRTVYYAEAAAEEYNINGIIGQIIQNMPIYIMIFYCVNRIFYKHYMRDIKHNMQNIYLFLFRFAYVCVYVSSLFIFVETSSAMTIRVRAMGVFPLVFVVGKLLSMEKKSDIWTYSIVFSGIIAILWVWRVCYNM